MNLSRKATTVLYVVCCLVVTAGLSAQEKKPVASDNPVASETANQDAPAEDVVDAGVEFVLSDDVREALIPLFKNVTNAKVSRTTVEMLTDVLFNGRVIENKVATFQIASKVDNKFTVYLKEPERRTRLYCDGKNFQVAMAPDAYVEFDKMVDAQTLVMQTPVILGPYPEPVLALSLAGVDPAVTLVAGMTSLEIVDREPYRDGRPAVHLAGVQADGVNWDLWISADEEPQPLRMLIDLTPMLVASGKMNIPDGYSHQIRYDFQAYRMSGEVDESLFMYKPSEGAKKYASPEEYYAQKGDAPPVHEMTGKPAPAFRALDIEGKILDTRQLRGKVVIVDFWASWCQPCLEAMPIIEKVVQTFEGEPVVLLSINTGEELEKVKEFFSDRKTKAATLLDPNGRIADGYKADRIPQTVVINPNGVIQNILMGFADEEDLTRRLTDTINDALKVKAQ
jgi:thiol-disulfide isomerase/thioredoxin